MSVPRGRIIEPGGFESASVARQTAARVTPCKGDKIAQRLRLQGNPSEKQDFYIEPKTNEVYDFIRFARTEGRFSKHFDKDGNPSETLIKAKQKRLDNWRTLQELAGII